MITIVAGLSALALGAGGALTESVPLSQSEALPLKHPGQNGTLDAEQAKIAIAAWRYFENNTQAETCLTNSVDKYPSTTMWDVAAGVAALVAAFEFKWIDPPTFDEKMGCLLDSLNRMPLYRDELPNKAYNTMTLEEVDYANNPAEIGVSAIDLGRLLTWLAIVKTRYPMHAEKVDRAVLRWSFCNVVDRGGTLYGAVTEKGGSVTYLQEGRLGYEEYAANGFQLWGFATEAASQIEPRGKVKIYGVPISYDGRDPARYGAHNYVVTEAYLLSGLEMNWDHPHDTTESDLWLSDRASHTLATKVYKAQYKRWKETGILTARTEHHVDGAPYFVYDTIYTDGVEWATIADDGKPYPELAAVSTKAALGMSVLFDTPYTEKLAAAVLPLVDPERGIFEGYYEADGRRVEALTANTNGIVLETLLYKMQGKLYRNNNAETLWDRVPNGEYNGNSQCLPRTLKEPGSSPEGTGRYEVSRQVAK